MAFDVSLMALYKVNSWSFGEREGRVSASSGHTEVAKPSSGMATSKGTAAVDRSPSLVTISPKRSPRDYRRQNADRSVDVID
jgi:hypothetical protein